MTLLTRNLVYLLLAALLSGCALNPFSRGKASQGKSTRKSEAPAAISSTTARSSIPSNELKILREYLEGSDQGYRFDYAQVDGRRYQWILTRHVEASRILYHFRSGTELASNGQPVVGSELTPPQYFTIALDPDSLVVDRLYSGQ